MQIAECRGGLVGPWSVSRSGVIVPFQIVGVFWTIGGALLDGSRVPHMEVFENRIPVMDA